jgi:phenylalanyl-tRNA synthetase alpha subunit
MSEESNSSEELDRIAKEKEKEMEIEKEKEKSNNKFYDGSEATFENSIRNKYKRKKTEEIEKKKQNDEKLRATPKYNNINTNINNSRKQYDDRYNKRNNNKKENNEKENKDKNNGQFNMKNYARRLSKMNISSTNWNINQLGDMLTYPDVTEIEA